jgi:hypothetical protein
MTTNQFSPGDPIAWISFMADHDERPASGHVWAPAPPIPGVGRAYWVIPDGGGDVVLVAMAARRHRARVVGRGGSVKPVGRWIDPGEIYTQTYQRGLASAGHAMRRFRAGPDWTPANDRAGQALEIFSAMCEEAARDGA